MAWSGTAKKILARHPSKQCLMWPQKQPLPFIENKNWTLKFEVSWRFILDILEMKRTHFLKTSSTPTQKEQMKVTFIFPVPQTTPTLGPIHHFCNNHFFIWFWAFNSPKVEAPWVPLVCPSKCGPTPLMVTQILFPAPLLFSPSCGPVAVWCCCLPVDSPGFGVGTLAPPAHGSRGVCPTQSPAEGHHVAQPLL